MTTSPNGRKLIESFEGLRLTAYRDQGGVLTIGYGSTLNVYEGETITQEEADNRLAIELGQTENALNAYIKVPVNQNQFDALISLAFNIGEGAFKKSTLLSLLNQGATIGAANQFLVWDKIGGVENRGLMNRRAAERALFMTPVEEK
jgi:lysozyme